MKFNVRVTEGENKGAIVYSNVEAKSKYEAEVIACMNHRMMFDVRGIKLTATSRIVR